MLMLISEGLVEFFNGVWCDSYSRIENGKSNILVEPIALSNPFHRLYSTF